MYQSKEHEAWVKERLNNPQARPVFEEHLQVRGIYPPPEFMDKDDMLEAMLEDIKSITVFAKEAGESLQMEVNRLNEHTTL